MNTDLWTVVRWVGESTVHPHWTNPTVLKVLNCLSQERLGSKVLWNYLQTRPNDVLRNASSASLSHSPPNAPQRYAILNAERYPRSFYFLPHINICAKRSSRLTPISLFIPSQSTPLNYTLRLPLGYDSYQYPKVLPNLPFSALTPISTSLFFLDKKARSLGRREHVRQCTTIPV